MTSQALNDNIIFTKQRNEYGFEYWNNQQLDYAGMILCQDYTSTKAKVDTNNLFAPSKISISIENCTGPNGKINFGTPESVSGTGDLNQLLYVYRDKGTPKLLPYTDNADKYPTITCVDYEEPEEQELTEITGTGENPSNTPGPNPEIPMP